MTEGDVMRHWIPVVLCVLIGSLALIGSASADWPMFQGSLEKSGYYNGTLPQDNTTMWTAESDFINYNTPTIANGVAYFSGFDYKVHAVDIRNGEELWATPLDWITVQSTAAIDLDNDQLYLANLNTLFALDLMTGDIVWEFRNQWGFAESGFSWLEAGSPAYYNNFVYYGSFDGYLYKFPANDPNDDGIMSLGEAEWAYETGDLVPDSAGVFYTPVTVSPETGLVFGATVVEGGTNPGALYAIWDDTGDLEWRYEFSAYSTPIINFSIPGYGSHSTSGPSYDVDAGTNGIIWCPNGGYFYAIEITTGDLIYQKERDNWIWGQTASWNDTNVFIGDDDGFLVAYDKETGAMDWEVDLGGPIRTSPVWDDNGFMYTSQNDFSIVGGVVTCLNMTTREIIWEYETPAWTLSSFGVDEGVLIISVSDFSFPYTDHYVYAFGDKPMEIDLQVRTVMADNPVEGKLSPIIAKVFNDGTMSAWDVEVEFYDGDPEGSGEFINSTIAPRLRPGEDTPVVLDWAFGMDGNHEIYAVVDSDNTVDETREANNIGSGWISIISGRQAPVCMINNITPNDVYQIGSVMIEFNGSAEDDGTIEEYIWTSNIDGFISSQDVFNISVHALSSGTHYITFSAIDDDDLQAPNATAMLFIRPNVGDPWPEWMHDYNNTGTSSSSSVPLPSVEWRHQLNLTTERVTLGSPVAINGVVYYASIGGVKAVDFETGETIWFNDTAANHYSTPAVSSEHGILVTVGDDIVGWFTENGTEAWRIYINDGWEYTSPTIAGNIVYVAERKNCQLFALNITTGAEIWTTDFANSYILSSPSVGFDHIYIVAPNFDNEESFLAIYGLDIDDGQMDWRWKLNPGQIADIGVPFLSSGDGYSSPVLYEDGSGNGYVVVTDLGGSIYALEPDGEDPRGLPDNDGTGLFGTDDGEVIWQWDEPDGFAAINSPSYHDGKLFFSTIKGEVISLDAFDGSTEYWTYDTEFLIWASPVIADDGIVYVTSWDSYLYAFDLDGNGDGTTDLLWRTMTTPYSFIYGVPALYNGSLLMLGGILPGFYGDDLYCYSPFVDQPELELSSSMVILPDVIAINDTITLMVGIANRGVADSNARVDVYINETDREHRIGFRNLFIPAGNVSGFECNWNTTNMSGKYTIIVVVSDPNDPITANNMVEVSAYVVKPGEKPLAEIDAIEPNPVERSSSNNIYFSGTGHSAANITDYLWNASGVFLSDEAEFTEYSDDEIFSLGDNEITFTVKDDTGQWADEVTETLRITAPGSKPVAEILDISPNPANIADTILFEGKGTSGNGRNITGYKWWWSGGTLSTLASFEDDADTFGTGKWDINFQVEDEDGKKSVIVWETLKVISGDPPEVEITEPWDGNETEGVVTIEGTATSDEDVTLVEVAYSEVGEEPDFDTNGLDVDGTETWSTVWDTDGLSGDMEIHARAQSRSGLESDVVSITVTIISTLPTVEITYPATGDLTGTEVKITGTASDDSAVDKVQVKIGTSAWTLADDDSGNGSWSDWSYLWNISGYDDGDSITIRARATDDDGDFTQDSVTVKIVKPNIRPEIEIVFPVSGSGVLADIITVEGSASDDVEISRIQISVNDKIFSDPIELEVGDETYYYWYIQLDTTIYPADEHKLYARAQDNDGAFSNNASVDIRIDNRVPEAIIDSVKPGVAVWGKDTIIMKGHATMVGDDYNEDRDIAEWKWTTNRGGVLGTNATIVVKAEDLSVGVHEIELSVKGSNGKWSDAVSTQVNVKKAQSDGGSDDEWWEIPGMEATAAMTALAAAILLFRKRR